jgi:hypothetical protein
MQRSAAYIEEYRKHYFNTVNTPDDGTQGVLKHAGGDLCFCCVHIPVHVSLVFLKLISEEQHFFFSRFKTLKININRNQSN